MQVLVYSAPEAFRFTPERDGIMAVSEKEFRVLSVSVAEIRGGITASKWFMGISTAVLIPLLSWICISIVNLKSDVSSLGIGKSASQLNSGKSPEQVKQSLTAIIAEATLLQVEGKAPNKGTAKALGAASEAVASAIDRYPQYPEVWKAASSLVNVRSLNGKVEIPSDVVAKVGPPVPNRGDCFTIPMGPSSLGQMPPELNNYVWILGTPWHDCTLYLDDVQGFNRSTLMTYVFEKIGANKELIFFDFTLVRVNIVYRGGPIIPIRRVIFYDCWFGFNVPSAPPSGRGKDLLEAILSKSFDRNLEINVPIA